MRFDVDRPEADFAAENNPFVDGDGDDRIFVYGLRNPWRYSFDAQTGDMYIADVGKKTIEEINVVPSGVSGLNFGWPGYEGTNDGPNTDAQSAIDDHTEPIFEYTHQSQDELIRGGRSIVGGYVYRGEAIPALQGYYVFSDTFSGDVAAIRYCDSNDPDTEPEIVDTLRLGVTNNRTGPPAFATDTEGELYMIGRDEALKIKPAQ
jgi:glucose/arabinose dehydrogenase